MNKIDEIPIEFILKNIPNNTVQRIEIKWELIKRCENVNNISAVCRMLSNELEHLNHNYSPLVLRMMYYS